MIDLHLSIPLPEYLSLLTEEHENDPSHLFLQSTSKNIIKFDNQFFKNLWDGPWFHDNFLDDETEEQTG